MVRLSLSAFIYLISFSLLLFRGSVSLNPKPIAIVTVAIVAAIGGNNGASLPEFSTLHFVAFDLDTSFKSRFKAASTLKAPFEEHLRSLVSSDSPPTCIISDMFLGWTQGIGAQYQVPRYCFFTSPAHFLSMTYLLPQIYAEGRIPVERNEKPFVIPGFPAIEASDMHHMHMAGTDPETIRTWIANSQSLWEAAGVLVNSTYEIESAIVDGLRALLASKLKTTKVLSQFTLIFATVPLLLPLLHFTTLGSRWAARIAA